MGGGTDGGGGSWVLRLSADSYYRATTEGTWRLTLVILELEHEVRLLERSPGRTICLMP